MNTTEILTKIKTLLGVESEEVRLAQMKLEDGLTIVESDFEEGASIEIVTEDGKVSMPVGDYTLEDGRMVVVKEEGLIAEIKEAKEEEEEETTEEVTEEEARSEEDEKEMYKEETKAPKKVIESITKESFFSEIEKLKEENESLKKELEGLKLSSVENTEVKETEKENGSTEVELSTEEEPKPIVFNPENEKKIEGFKYSQNRRRTTLDRVMDRLSE